jgi:8-oxo-dGTP diphosphatase
VKVFVVRHAKAGDRLRWEGPDDIRPLTKSGRKQAKALVKQLKDEEIARILSSPYARCVETVEPLAEARGLPVEEEPRLAEGTPAGVSWELVAGLQAPTVLCTHGDVGGDIVARAAELGVEGADSRLCQKGSTWVLEGSGGTFHRATYLAPPA